MKKRTIMLLILLGIAVLTACQSEYIEKINIDKIQVGKAIFNTNTNFIIYFDYWN